MAKTLPFLRALPSLPHLPTLSSLQSMRRSRQSARPTELAPAGDVSTLLVPDALSWLQQHTRWVVWVWSGRDGKRTKVPLSPVTHQGASSTNPDDWATYPVALAYQQRIGAAGLQYAIGWGLAFLDLDSCRDPRTGVLEDWAQSIVQSIPSYWEVSVSGTGVHGLTFASLPPTGRKRGNIEIYSEKRFMIWTGNHLPGTPQGIADCDSAIQSLHAAVFPQPKSRPRPTATSFAFNGDLSDRLAQATRSRSGARLERLLAGNWLEYPSESEGRYALINDLHFWLDGDADAMERAVLDSGFWNEKLSTSRNHQTLLRWEIEKRLQLGGETYESVRQTRRNHGNHRKGGSSWKSASSRHTN